MPQLYGMLFMMMSVYVPLLHHLEEAPHNISLPQGKLYLIQITLLLFSVLCHLESALTFEAL